MAESLVIYTVLHQPRRLRIPAEPLQVGAGTRAIEHAMFDDELDERCFHQAARECYYPAATLLLELIAVFVVVPAVAGVVLARAWRRRRRNPMLAALLKLERV